MSVMLIRCWEELDTLCKCLGAVRVPGVALHCFCSVCQPVRMREDPSWCFSSWKVHICGSCIHVCSAQCGYTCFTVHLCMEAIEQHQLSFFRRYPSGFFETGSLTETKNSSSRLWIHHTGWLTSSKDPPVSVFPVLGFELSPCACEGKLTDGLAYLLPASSNDSSVES